jgi:hypothetical protein
MKCAAMAITTGVGPMDRMAFNAMFSADWLFGRKNLARLLPRRWDRLNGRMLSKAARGVQGRILAVERRADLTPQEFRDKYFLTGIPVVLERAAAQWPALKKWTPDYLNTFCGDERIEVLDGQNWQVNRADDREAVSTSEHIVRMRELLKEVKGGGAWYGAFIELLDKYAELRGDLDLGFVRKFGHTSRHLPWHQNIIAKMYVGGAGTATSLHCAAVSNLYVQIYGRKKWVLVAPEFTPFMYPAATRGLNWQSRVDFRNPDFDACPLYRFVDRYETVLEPGDVLWNPPFVWHGVANVTESIAVSCWWINLTRGFSNSLLLGMLTACGRPNPIAMQLGFIRTKSTKSSNFSVHLNK